MYKLLAGAVVCVVLAGAAVQCWIAVAVKAAGPPEELIRRVDCGICGLRERDRAVWALGETGDRRALPVLRRHLTGRRCDHDRGLCQYELDKAIRKIERTWSIVQRIRL